MSRYPQSNDYGMKAYHNQQAQPIFREVWANNLEEEIKNLIEALEDYKFVAMVCSNDFYHYSFQFIVCLLIFIKSIILKIGYRVSWSCC